MKNKIHEAVAANLKLLMACHGGINQVSLAKKTGLSQRTISNVLRPGSVGSITTDTIESLAEFFKIEPYHLMIPNLPIEELLSKSIESLIECYARSSEVGRENIKRIAENELRYK